MKPGEIHEDGVGDGLMINHRDIDLSVADEVRGSHRTGMDDQN